MSGALTPARAALVSPTLGLFICGFAGSSPIVVVGDISADLHTTVQGVQLVITTFLLVVAMLMIPGGRFADRYGGKRCFAAGQAFFGIGAVLSALAPGTGWLFLGDSILEGVGAALLIPSAYALAGPSRTDTATPARALVGLTTVAGIGATAGPLLGGIIAAGLGWRAIFVFQVLVIAAAGWLGRHIDAPAPVDPAKPFDIPGAVLSTVGVTLLVMGALAADEDVRLMWALLALGAVVLVWCFRWVRGEERAGREPLVSSDLFRHRAVVLGLITQNLQWLLLTGTVFVVAAYLQVVWGYGPGRTGVLFLATIVGPLGARWAAARSARRYTPRVLIMTGFAVAVIGVDLLLVLAGRDVSSWAFVPGLLLVGMGSGVMLFPSIDVVRSGFGERQPREIPGLSHGVSALGAALGPAVAGTVLTAGPTGHAYATAMIVLAAFGIAGLGVAAFLPTPPATPRAR
ncbi:MFS transporter [Nocardia paucivorans]|uniref:MFS transporter n=1 Tax=Nocardia paucivorans TaxID=114259 RepID=UPI0002E8C2F4|nr:MFS transporter [Nocardia paucivorans]